MPDPTVCCILLVNGREAMVKRAIASFRAQTYERKRLLILDSAKIGLQDTPYGEEHATTVWMPDMCGRTVGALRNAANWCAVERYDADLIAHFDSDDWSHPRRLEEQVSVLLSSGKMCVGYRKMLFWDTRCSTSEAWLYHNGDPQWAAGASFLMRREAWEACPYDDAPHEDQRWWVKNAANCLGRSGLGFNAEPRLIAQIHGGNTESYDPAVMAKSKPEWTRTPEWDAYCAQAMEL